MGRRGKAFGGALKNVLVLLVIGLLAGAGWYAYKKTRPKPPPADPRFNFSVETVPPQGIAPFDPKPIMDGVEARIKTDKFRFAALGDSKHAATLPAFLKYVDEVVNPDFVLTTGDMVIGGGGKVGPGYYEMLEKEAGPAMRKRPWWPAIGNHEVAGGPVYSGSKNEAAQLRGNQLSGIENFKRFYNLGSDHYSFAFRNCYFIALPFPQPRDEELPWLEAELKKASEAKQHIFIFNHTPYYTVGAKGSDDVPNIETPITKLFDKYHVCAVFSGHDHGFYRTVRNGIPYMISAGGGATIYAGKRVSEAKPGDVYYYAQDGTIGAGKKPVYVLHRADGTEKLTDTPDQFLCVIDVDGDKINCYTTTVKGEKWDELPLK